MMTNDQTILVGVDMKNAEKDIKKLIANISKKYKFKLELIIQNKDSVIREVNSIQKLIASIGKIDIDYGLGKAGEEINKLKRSIKELSKIDVAKVGKEFVRQQKEAKRQTDELVGAYAQLLKMQSTAAQNQPAMVVNEKNEASVQGTGTKASSSKDSKAKKEESIPDKLAAAMNGIPSWQRASESFEFSFKFGDQMKKGFEQVVELDRAMIDLKSTSGASSQELDAFKDRAFGISKEMGIASASVVKATTEFQKLGYTLEQSTALSENSMLLSKVGGMGIGDASASIIAVLRGFDIEVDKYGNNVRSVVDMFTAVKNNYSITSEGLGSALKDSSSDLKKAGNTVQQSIGMITAANIDLKDPEKAGEGLKTIAMRLQGLSESGEKVRGAVPQIEKTFASLNEKYKLMGSGALNVMKEDQTTFKSTYEIFQSLSQVWDKLSKEEKVDVSSKIGGDQSEIVSSIIENWSKAKGATETAMSSAGSAAQAFNKHSDSFEARIGKLQTSLSEFWNTFSNSEVIKDIISGLTTLVEFLTKVTEMIGALPIATVFAGLSGLSKFDALKNLVMGSSSIGTFFSVIGKGIARIVPYVGALLMIGEVIQGLFNIINKPENDRKDRLKFLDDDTKRIKKFKEDYDSIFDGKNMDVDTFENLQLKGKSRTIEEEEKYLGIIEQIKTKMPELISHYDEYGNAVAKSADEIKRLRVEEEQRELKNNKEELKLKLDGGFGEVDKNIKEIRNNKKQIDFQDTRLDFAKRARMFIETDIKDIKFDDIEGIKEAFTNKMNPIFDALPKDKALDVDPFYTILINSLQGSPDRSAALANFDKFINDIISKKEEYEVENQNLKDSIIHGSTEFNESINLAFQNYINSSNIPVGSNKFLFIESIKQIFMENIDDFGENTKDAAQKIPSFINEIMGAIQSNKISIDDLMNVKPEQANNMLDVIDNIKEKLSKNPVNNPFLKLFNDIRVGHQKAANEINNTRMKIDPKNAKEIENLRSAYHKLADGQKLSKDSITELLSTYPSLNDAIYIENGNIQLTADGLKDLMQQREKEFQDDIDKKKKQGIAAKDKAVDTIEAIENEIDALELLMDARNLYDVDVDKIYDDAKKKNDEIESNRKKGIYTTTIDEINAAKELTQAGYNRHIKHEYYGNKEKLKDIKKKVAAKKEQASSGSSSGGSSHSSNPKPELQDAIYVVDKYKEHMDELTQSIEKQQRIQEKYSTWSKQHRQALSEEIRLSGEKKKTIDNEISSLKEQIKQKQIKKTGYMTVDKNKNANKTKQAIEAEIAQEIAQATERLNDLQSQSSEMESVIAELNSKRVDATASMYSHRRETLSEKIDYQDYVMDLYDSTTQGYRDHAAEKIQLLSLQKKSYQDEINFYEEQLKNKDLSELKKDELKKSIEGNYSEMRQKDRAINSEKTKIANSVIDKHLYRMNDESKKYAKSIQQLEDNIRYDVDKEDGDYAKHIGYLQQIAGLRKGEANDIKNNIKFLKSQLELNKNNKDIVERLTDEIEKQEDKLQDTERSVKDLNVSVKEIYEKAADRYVELYKEKLELLKKADEEHYRLKLEQEKQVHENRMKQIDKELKALQDAYDQQMKMLDRTESTRTYENDLSKKQDEITDLKKQIDLLSMDDSYEAKSQKADLIKQLTEKEQELSEYQHNREIELRKNNLEDELDSEQEKLDSKKEKMEEEYNNTVKLLEQKAEERQKFWENELNNEQKFADMRKQVYEGNFNEMLETVNTWSGEVDSKFNELGQTVTENFTDKVKEAIRELNKLNDSKLGSMGSIVNDANPHNLDGSNKPTAGLPDNSLLSTKDKITEMISNSKKWKLTTDEKERKRLEEENRKLGKEIGAVYKYGTWYKDGKPLHQFDTGGYTGDWNGNSGKLALLDKKELVLNAEQTKHILDTARIVEQIRSAVPSFPVANFMQASIPTVIPAPANEQHEYNIEVNVNGNADRNTADIVATEIVNKLKRTRGGRF
ncbi:phage tail tape measure protein [Paenibacillus sp. chi10]|uniref:Phage tail tape measure protein n=1 Tax=Paenibacillus suaedae TaxID=3077233 RepID=A0AAJ2JSI3_9BACL|nr:phage tail tape measure protein [Paenibacillus sp. chi10]MDT8975021.1 phage tail tape measure protein [Paenibacillus sp. chi10]